MAGECSSLSQEEEAAPDYHWTSPISYRRIRIVNRGDIEATYPLLAAYVQNPELALTIDEIAADPGSWMEMVFGRPNQELDEPAKPVREDAHAAIEAYARGLGLGEFMTQKMIDALQWKRAHLMGQKPPVPVSGGFMMKNREYAYTATTLLLSLSKNVQTLHFGDMGVGTHQPHSTPRSLDRNTPLENYLLYSNYNKLASPGLQKLKHLRYVSADEMQTLLDSSCYDDVDFLAYLRCFHRLPALESITMDAVMEYQRVTRDIFPPRTGSFKSLRITHAEPRTNILGIMIRIPMALEEFALSVGGLWHRDGGSGYFQFKTLGKCLLEHKETLRILDLDIGRQCGNWPDEEDEYSLRNEDEFKDELFYIDEKESPGPLWPYQLPESRPYGRGIGSLHDFTALTHLSISIDAILGCAPDHYMTRKRTFDAPFRLVDGLPANLEFLRIYGYTRGENETVDEHLDELMEKMAERLPKLRKIEGLKERIDLIWDRKSDIKEEDMWERPAPQISWVEA